MVDTVYLRQVMETQLRGIFEVDGDGRSYGVWRYDSLSHDNIYTTSDFRKDIGRDGNGNGWRRRVVGKASPTSPYIY